jgi:hypothetical protein
MKQCISILLGVFLLIILIGCGGADEAVEKTGNASARPPRISFKSVEELIDAHKTVRNGGILNEEIDVYKPDETNFAALEKLYIPTNIPETYGLLSIEVIPSFVTFYFLPEEYLVSSSTRWEERYNNKDFRLASPRGDDDWANYLIDFRHDDKELIDGKYLQYRPNAWRWEYDNKIMYFHTPLPPDTRWDTTPKQLARYLGLNDISDLTQFLTLETLDLYDDAAVDAFLASLSTQN